MKNSADLKSCRVLSRSLSFPKSFHKNTQYDTKIHKTRYRKSTFVTNQQNKITIKVYITTFQRIFSKYIIV